METFETVLLYMNTGLTIRLMFEVIKLENKLKD